MANPTDLRAADQREAARKKRLRWEAETEDKDFVWLMQEPRGRCFVWRLLRDSGFGADPFSANTSVMSNQVGKQSVGRKLFAMASRLCPDLWLKMTEENVEMTDDSK